MPSSPVVLVIFEGGTVSSPQEEVFQKVRQGAVLDLIRKAIDAGIEHILLCTPYLELLQKAQQMGVDVEFEAGKREPFHFGRRLSEVVIGRNMEKVLYMGGASAPLISSAELRYIVEILEQNEGVVLANNYHSADIVGFTPGSSLNKVALPSIDNSLALSLVHDAQLRFVELQRTLGLNFDLDTPADLLVLAAHPDVGLHTKKALEGLEIDASKCLRIQEVIAQPLAEMVVFGRVNSNVFRFLDENTRCRIRLYSEERGMKSLGRDERCEVFSLVGELVVTLGYERFFAFLAEICDAALLDSRVLFEHFRWKLTQTERFCSDWGLIEEITHPGLRDFTRAASNASIPILLGGHSMVTGGLWALVDAGARQR